MRSAAALASALEEVAQVRYSRSGVAVGSRRLNHDLGRFDLVVAIVIVVAALLWWRSRNRIGT